jgi:hypothetical protein
VRKRLRLAAILGCGIVPLALAGLLALYRASQHVPEFYRRALAADPVRQKQASHEMEQQACALSGRLEESGPWHVRFTAEQINGWLAVGMVELDKRRDLLPPTIRDPRVAIEPDRMILACRYEQGAANSVLEKEPNALAVRIRNFRAGLLPIPLTEITTPVAQAAKREANLRLQWRREGNDPVAILSLPDVGGNRVHIDTLELREGEIYLAGTAERRR